VLEVRHAEHGRVMLVKPMRYMNRSGGPLRSVLRNTDVDITSDVLLVTVDIDLPLGRVRLRRSGSAGGHNGLRDVIASFGTDEFSRLRIGVGRTGEAASHVLATFRPDERDLATEMVAVGADAAERWLLSGIEDAMNAFNGIDLGG
jgi:PTH1 family peptidyl-tRNA hydrolase